MPRKIIVPTGDPTSPVSMDAGTLRRLGLDPRDIEKMSEKEKILLFQSLQELADSGSSVTLQSLEAEDFKYPPVSMEQFLADPYYAGDIAKSMYPAVKAMLIEVFDQGGVKPVELVLAGAIGWGKSTASAMALVYVSYRLSCLHDPHDYYGLMRGADIVIGIYSVTIDQALDGVYGKMLHWFDQIPYFIQKCPRVKRINSEIKFSNLPLLIIAGSNELHTIGKDMLCFCLAEGEKVQTSHGLVNVENLDPKIHRLVAPSGLESFDRIEPVGDKPCVEVALSNGKTVVASEDHLFLVKRSGTVAWVKAIDLCEGDETITMDEANYDTFDRDVCSANEELHSLWRVQAARRRLLLLQVQGSFAEEVVLQEM